MTTIAQGASATINIPAGYTLETTGSGTLTYGPGRLAGQPKALSDSASVGPFSSAQIVYLTAGSNFNYRLNINDPSLKPALSVVAGDGSPALLADGDTIKLLFANSIIPVGDSISRNHWATTAGATLTRLNGVTTMTGAATGMMDGMYVLLEQFTNTSFNRFVGPITRISSTSFSYADPGTNATTSAGFIANPYRLADNGWFTWLRAILGNRIIMPSMGSRGGDRIDQIYARMDADVMAYQPSGITVMAGINDIVQSLTADANGNLVAATPALMFANLKKIYDKARAAGITVYACTTLPIEYGYGSLADAVIDAYNVKVMGVNALIRAECTKAGMILCPTYEAVVDSNSAKGQPLTGMMSGDKIHPAAKGAKAVADAVAAQMLMLIPPRNTLVASAYDNRNSAGATASNVFTYLPSAATGGTVSGTNASGTCPLGINVAAQGAPTSVVASGAARTVADDGDVIGYNAVAVLTAAAANDGVTFAGAGGWAGNVVAGKAYCLEICVSVLNVAGSNLSKLFAELNFTVAGTTYSLRAFDQTSSTFPTTDMVNYVLQTVPFFLPATPSNTSWDVQAICSAAGTAITIKVGRPNVKELAAGTVLTF